MTQRLLIYGYFGWYNAGDDLIGYGILKELSNRNQSVAITLTSKNIYFENHAKILFQDMKIKTIKFRFLSLLKAIIKSDKFIIAGGTHFTDEDQFIFRKMRLFAFFYIITLWANIVSKPPILLGHGIGPVTKPWNKFLLKRILRISDMVIVRDGDSADIVRSLGYDKKCILGFDCSLPFIESMTEYPHTMRNIIGLSILPAYGIYSKKPSLDTRVVISLSASVQKLMMEFPSLQLRLFSFHGGGKDSDEPIVRELNSHLGKYSDKIQIIYYNGDIIEFLSKIKECDIFIGMRYHSSLIAYILKKYLIIIDYMGKCRSLAKDIHQKNEYILSINEILLNPDGNLLYSRLQKMIINNDVGYLNSTTEDPSARQKTMFSIMADYLK